MVEGRKNSVMLPKKWKISFSSGITIATKMKCCNQCNNDIMCDECNFLVNETNISKLILIC